MVSENKNNAVAAEVSTARPFFKAFPLYVVVSLFLFFEMAVQVSPGVMAFKLMRDLHISALGLGVMSGCYFYTYTAMQIPSGMLFDRFNPRLVICASLLVCVAGCLALSFAQGFWMACGARLLTGFGSAFAFVSVLVVTKDLFNNRYFATMTGITQMLAAFGAMSGQLPVSVLVNGMGWRSTMLIFAGVGAVIALGVFVFLRYERPVVSSESDANGSKPCAAKAQCAADDGDGVPLNATAEESPCPQVSDTCRARWLGGLRGVLANKQTWFVALYACLLWAPMSGFASLWGVPFLVTVDHFSKSQAALLVSLMWLGLALASPLLGGLSTWFNNRRWPLVGSALLGTLGFSVVLLTRQSVAVAAGVLFLAGAACAGQALSFTVIKENNRAESVATAIALNNMAVVISGAVFQPLIGLFLHLGRAQPALHYQTALSLVLVAYGLAFMTALCFIREPDSAVASCLTKHS